MPACGSVSRQDGMACRRSSAQYRPTLVGALTSRMWRGAALIAIAVFAALPFRATAQEAGDRAEGRRLAGAFCSNCHVITPTTKAKGSNGVPTFAAVARRPSTTPASLRNSLLSPHPQISSMQATPDELRDLIAYILSLREK